jgi:prophage regulatory protein
MSAVVPLQPALEPEDAAAFCALSVTTMERLEREGNFPRRRQLSDRRVGHLVSELLAWLHARPVSELPPPANTGARKPRRARTLQIAHQGG